MNISHFLSISLVSFCLAACSFQHSTPIASHSPNSTVQSSNRTPTVVSTPRVLANCSQLDTSWERFESSITKLSFCYPTVWGIPEEKPTIIAAEFRKGNMWEISFPQVKSNPAVYYYTQDFMLTEPRDAMMVHEEVCLTCINSTMSAETLQKILQIPNNIFKSVKRADHNGNFGIALEKSMNSAFDPNEIIHEFAWIFPETLGEKEMNLVFISNDNEKEAMARVVRSSVF